MTTTTTTRPAADQKARRTKKDGRPARSRRAGSSIMDSITLENFRCFHEKQTAQLAPLTVLVGENSTGKTSLMAMIRILWDSIDGLQYPDFKEEPYDLGSFEDVAHNRSGGGGKAKYFQSSFTKGKYSFKARFEKNGASPVLVDRSYANGNTTLEETFKGNTYSARIQTKNGVWRFREPITEERFRGFLPGPLFMYFSISTSDYITSKEFSMFRPLQGSPEFENKDFEEVISLQNEIYKSNIFRIRPFAGAPVRSKPRRTYDPSRHKLDSEGDTIPMYIASKFFEGESSWNQIRSELEKFGKDTGLFDEIKVKPLPRGKTGNESDPFQLQIRKYSGKFKGPWLNIVDVGYGISQMLPIFVEMIDKDASRISLLQQPEIHLHPSGQAALATILCQQARKDRQYIIETHSDYIIDRVRMEVRDGKIKESDVSILYFERTGLDVKIHSLRYDKAGNVLDAPPSYGRFFMEEVDKSIGL